MSNELNVYSVSVMKHIVEEHSKELKAQFLEIITKNIKLFEEAVSALDLANFDTSDFNERIEELELLKKDYEPKDHKQECNLDTGLCVGDTIYLLERSNVFEDAGEGEVEGTEYVFTNNKHFIASSILEEEQDEWTTIDTYTYEEGIKKMKEYNLTELDINEIQFKKGSF